MAIDLRRHETDRVSPHADALAAPLRMACLAWWLAACLGCQSLLPSDSTSESEFASFEEARRAFDAIVPGETTRDELRELGIDPDKRGTSVSHYASIVDYFFPHQGVDADFVDPAVLSCIRARDRCEIWGVQASRDKGKRQTPIVLDWLKIHVLKKRSGFRFDGVVFVEDGVATGFLYRGRPRYRATEERIQPLGPLQNGIAVKIRPLFTEPHVIIIGGKGEDRPTMSLPNPLVNQILAIFEEENANPEEEDRGPGTMTGDKP